MTKRGVALRKQRLFCLGALQLLCQIVFHRPTQRASATLGRGYGAPGFTRASFERIRAKPVWRAFRDGTGDAKAFEHQCLMTVDEFRVLLLSLQHMREPLAGQATTLRFEDKILLIFHWLVQYVDYKVLAQRFGTTTPVITALFTAALPLLVGHFTRAIPNRLANDSTRQASALSDQIVAVITQAQHSRKKDGDNDVFPHGMSTHMLVDYDGYIASFVTAVSQRVYVHEVTDRFDSFNALLGERYVIGDRAYSGAPRVVTDADPRINGLELALYEEQRRVTQPVNDFIAQCRVVSRENRFKHSRDKHIAVVFIVCGWYNWLRRNRRGDV